MSGTVQLDKWFRDSRTVAALMPADGLFGVLRRTIELPAAFAALVRRTDGRQEVVAAGGRVGGEAAEDLLVVRTTPLDLALVFPQIVAEDRYLCDARVTLSVQVLTERSDLEAVRDRLVGSRGSASLADLEQLLQPALDAALRAAMGERPAAQLVDGTARAALVQAATEALQAPCFSAGLALTGGVVVSVASPALQRIREAEERAARALDEHAAQNELRDALAGAQRAHLEHLEGMLARLNQLAERSPQVELSELMRSFEETQRGQLYAALLGTRARKRLTRSVAVVAGREVLFFDPQAGGDVMRRVEVDSPVGALRSIQYDAASGVLLIGAAHGVCLLAPDASAPAQVLRVAEDRAVRGGFNAVAIRGADVVATHSERGVIHWRLGDAAEGVPLLADQTRGANAVRCAQFADDRFWCSADANIFAVPADALTAAPATYCFNPYSSVSALLPAGATVYVGNSDGDVLAAPLDGAAPVRLHGGSRRPVESLALVAAGGIPRLFYTDTSLAVYCRVLGDTFTCRYEAGGQTVRRGECAGDLVAATTDARDRVLLWAAEAPERPATTLNVLRLTGHSVQDVCLVPFA